MWDIQLINGRLILAWILWKKIHILDVEKGELLFAIDWPHYLTDLKISGDGSRVFCLSRMSTSKDLDRRSVQAWSIHTAEAVGQVMVKGSINTESLTVDGSRVWVHDLGLEYQGWDFGTPESSPIQLPNTPPSRLHPNGIMLWDIGLCRIKDIRTGKVVFQLPKRYGDPGDVQWNGQYLIICFSATDALILDFSYIL